MPDTCDKKPVPPYTPPPVIRIDGEKIRRLRKDQGLTQLYLSTVIGVTTDTISRWENKRYQTIKLENAEKLARALEVPLEEIEETATQEQNSVPAAEQREQAAPDNEPNPAKLFPAIAVPIVILVTAALVYLLPLKPAGNRQKVIEAIRILPPHAPAGSSFPVLIRMKPAEKTPLALIIKETIPRGAAAGHGVPAITSFDPVNNALKWISRTTGEPTLYAYMCRLPDTLAPGATVSFSGTVTLNRQGGRQTAIKGDTGVATAPFHWADTNQDLVIDDEEILAVYELYSEIRGFNFDLDRIDDIWAGGGYAWDRSTLRFIVRK